MLFKKNDHEKHFKKLFLGSLILLLANCSPTNRVSENINRKWMLVEFQDFTKEFLIEKGANLDLSTKNQYSANMGCNRMFMKADFKADGAVIFSQIGSTRMFCDDAMTLEDAFGKALPAVTGYKTEGHFLTLTSKDGSTMKFVAADWD